MSRSSLLFDASCILTLVREIGGDATGILAKGSTLSLAYYEVGNAIWRECFLLKRITLDEASKVLESVFAILRTMAIAKLEDEGLGVEILDVAGKLGITYYDSAYLTMAQRLGKTLVTDDEKLARAAKKIGVTTLTSRLLQR